MTPKEWAHFMDIHLVRMHYFALKRREPDRNPCTQMAKGRPERSEGLRRVTLVSRKHCVPGSTRPFIWGRIPARPS